MAPDNPMVLNPLEQHDSGDGVDSNPSRLSNPPFQSMGSVLGSSSAGSVATRGRASIHVLDYNTRRRLSSSELRRPSMVKLEEQMRNSNHDLRFPAISEGSQYPRLQEMGINTSQAVASHPLRVVDDSINPYEGTPSHRGKRMSLNLGSWRRRSLREVNVPVVRDIAYIQLGDIDTCAEFVTLVKDFFSSRHVLLYILLLVSELEKAEKESTSEDVCNQGNAQPGDSLTREEAGDEKPEGEAEASDSESGQVARTPMERHLDRVIQLLLPSLLKYVVDVRSRGGDVDPYLPDPAMDEDFLTPEQLAHAFWDLITSIPNTRHFGLRPSFVELLCEQALVRGAFQQVVDSEVPHGTCSYSVNQLVRDSLGSVMEETIFCVPVEKKKKSKKGGCCSCSTGCCCCKRKPEKPPKTLRDPSKVLHLYEMLREELSVAGCDALTSLNLTIAAQAKSVDIGTCVTQIRQEQGHEAVAVPVTRARDFLSAQAVELAVVKKNGGEKKSEVPVQPMSPSSLNKSAPEQTSNLEASRRSRQQYDGQIRGSVQKMLIDFPNLMSLVFSLALSKASGRLLEETAENNLGFFRQSVRHQVRKKSGGCSRCCSVTKNVTLGLISFIIAAISSYGVAAGIITWHEYVYETDDKWWGWLTFVFATLPSSVDVLVRVRSKKMKFNANSDNFVIEFFIQPLASCIASLLCCCDNKLVTCLWCLIMIVPVIGGFIGICFALGVLVALSPFRFVVYSIMTPFLTLRQRRIFREDAQTYSSLSLMLGTIPQFILQLYIIGVTHGLEGLTFWRQQLVYVKAVSLVFSVLQLDALVHRRNSQQLRRRVPILLICTSIFRLADIAAGVSATLIVAWYTRAYVYIPLSVFACMNTVPVTAAFIGSVFANFQMLFVLAFGSGSRGFCMCCVCCCWACFFALIAIPLPFAIVGAIGLMLLSPIWCLRRLCCRSSAKTSALPLAFSMSSEVAQQHATSVAMSGMVYGTATTLAITLGPSFLPLLHDPKLIDPLRQSLMNAYRKLKIAGSGQLKLPDCCARRPHRTFEVTAPPVMARLLLLGLGCALAWLKELGGPYWQLTLANGPTSQRAYPDELEYLMPGLKYGAGGVMFIIILSVVLDWTRCGQRILRCLAELDMLYWLSNCWCGRCSCKTGKKKWVSRSVLTINPVAGLEGIDVES